MTQATDASLDLRQHTCRIVSAYVTNNHVGRTDLPALIEAVHAALNSLVTSVEIAIEEPSEKPTLAQIRKSITPDALVSFIDGKTYKTLKRHLRKHGLDPQTYRARYGLPADYPMVAASYSEHRSKLSLSNGSGRAKG